MFLIGYDLGSSSIKVSLLDANSGRCVGVVKYPEEEMPIAAPQPGWAAQAPELWWEYCGIATRQLLARYAVAPEAIAALGLAYQMHGLVLVDADQRVIRPAIIFFSEHQLIFFLIIFGCRFCSFFILTSIFRVVIIFFSEHQRILSVLP